MGTTQPCTPPPTIPPADLSTLLPNGITLPDDAELLQATASADTRTVIANTHLTPSAAHARATEQAKAAGYQVVKTDDEVVEAELYLVLPDGSFALVQQVRAKCRRDLTQTIVSVAAPSAGPPATLPTP